MVIGCSLFVLADRDSSRPPVLTEEEAIELYSAAKEAFSWFELAGLDCSLGDIVGVTGFEGDAYYRVTDDRFQTLSDLEDHLKALFTDEIASDLLNEPTPPVYADVDGKLYCLDFDAGSDITKGEDSVCSIEQADDDSRLVTVHVDILDVETLSKIGVEEHRFLLRHENDRWVFGDFYLIAGTSGVGRGTVVEGTNDQDAQVRYDIAEASLSNIRFHAAGAEEAALTFVREVYGQHLMNLPQDNRFSITGYALMEYSLQEVIDKTVSGTFVFAVNPRFRVYYVGLYTRAGAGEYEGWLISHKRFVLRQDDNDQWSCVSLEELHDEHPW